MIYVLFYVLGYFLMKHILYKYFIEGYVDNGEYPIDFIIHNTVIYSLDFNILLIIFPIGIPALFLYIYHFNNKLPTIFKSGRQIIDSKKQKDLDKKELLRPIYSENNK